MTLEVEVGDSDKHVALRTGEGQQVSQGLVERPLGGGIQRRGEEGSKETWERSWTGVGLISTETTWYPDLCSGPYLVLGDGDIDGFRDDGFMHVPVSVFTQSPLGVCMCAYAML